MGHESGREILELMLGHLGFVFEIDERQSGNQTVYNVRTRDPGRLIGRDGHTLDDLQYLLNRLLHGLDETASMVLIDVENYREKEHHDFLDRVRMLAQRVRETGRPETLPPMNSFDRRLVHHTFADDPDIATVSEASSARLKQVTLQLRRKKE
jgi:spoIIIJ-associated protein